MGIKPARRATFGLCDIMRDITEEGERHMASIIVRGLDESVKEQLAAQAKRNGRSMEAEARDILTRAARRPHIGIALMYAAQQAGGVDDLVIPERDDIARAADFE
jgi:plasmid stability protein